MQLHQLFLLQEEGILPYSQHYSGMANIKEQIELDAMNALPGILPPGTKFESYIGHNVINISKVNLSVHQTKALQKGLTFCPTPKGAGKSENFFFFFFEDAITSKTLGA